MVGRIYPDFAGAISLANLGIDSTLRDWNGYGDTYGFSMGGRAGTGVISRQDDFIYYIVFLYGAVPITRYFKSDGNTTRIDDSFHGHRSNLRFSTGIIPDFIAQIGYLLFFKPNI